MGKELERDVGKGVERGVGKGVKWGVGSGTSHKRKRDKCELEV